MNPIGRSYDRLLLHHQNGFALLIFGGPGELVNIVGTIRFDYKQALTRHTVLTTQ